MGNNIKKISAANVVPVRQRSQYTCMAASMAMALQSLGIETNEDEVNKVMHCRPGQGATWEDAIACAQHYGARATLTSPSTINQLKSWTDQGIPVLIAWNPEGRDWSHASLVFDVTENGMVHVADPNIPDPDEVVRVMPKSEFYSLWYEKWPKYLVRRPACAIEREITVDGRQVMASQDGKLIRDRITNKIARTGLYGATKKTQKDCESAINKLKKSASKIVKKALKKDERVVGFLNTYAEKNDNIAAKVLLAAGKEMMPKFAYTKSARRQRFSLYGYPEKVCNLGMSYCMEIKQEAGRIASELNRRRPKEYDKITSFLENHHKSTKCGFSHMLYSFYPNVEKTKQAFIQTEDGYIFWED